MGTMTGRCMTRRKTLALLVANTLALAGCNDAEPHDLVLYAAMDREVAAPLVNAFEQETGLRVGVIYDTETAKTVTLAARLRREREAPRADVWWSGESLHTHLLMGSGELETVSLSEEATLRPVTTGLRLRVLVYQSGNLPGGLGRPGSMADLAHPLLRGRIAMARPVTGTSLSHALHLASSPKGLALLRRIAENQPILLPGNAHVARAVLQGQAILGLCDSDDAVIVGEGRLEIAIPDQDAEGALAIPSTAAMVRNAPHAANGRLFLDWLRKPGTEALLVASRARFFPSHEGLASPPGFAPISDLKIASLDSPHLALRHAELLRNVLEIFPP